MLVWATTQGLVDKIADVGEDSLTQVHTQQSRVERAAKLGLKTFEDVTWKIGLLPKQAQQHRAIHCALVVTGYPTRRADGECKRDSYSGCGGTGRSRGEVDSHAGILSLICASHNDSVV